MAVQIESVVTAVIVFSVGSWFFPIHPYGIAGTHHGVAIDENGWTVVDAVTDTHVGIGYDP